MSNVIDLEATRRQRNEDRDRSDRDLLARIETALREGWYIPEHRRFRPRSAQLIEAAQFIDRLVQLAKAAGVSGGDLKDELKRMGRPSNFHKYSYPDSKPRKGDEADKAFKRLNRLIEGHLSIVEAVSHLTGEDAARLKISFLEHTEIWREPPTSTERLVRLGAKPGKQARELVLSLKDLAQYTVRRTHLTDLFEQMRSVKGVWDPVAERFKPSSMNCLLQDSYLHWNEHWTEAPPLPGVPVASFAHSDFVLDVRLQTKPHANPMDCENAHRFAGRITPARFRLFRELRVALGPSRSPEKIEPMFESRAQVRVVLPELAPNMAHDLRPAFTLKPIDDLKALMPPAMFQVHLADGWHRLSTMRAFDDADQFVVDPNSDPALFDLNPLDKGRVAIEHWYFSWLPINDAMAAYWLDREIEPGNVISLTPTDGDRARPVAASWPAQYLGHDLELSLANGAMEAALDREIALLRQRFNEHRETVGSRATQEPEDQP